MTTPAYSYVSQVGPFPFLINTADTINPGDALYFDAVTGTHRPLVDPTLGNLHSCIALGQYPLSSAIDNTQGATPPFVAGSIGGLHNRKATAGDVLVFGDPLYLGADSQTVTNVPPGGTDAGDIIGYFWPDNGEGMTAVAGDNIQIRPRFNFPTSFLSNVE